MATKKKNTGNDISGDIGNESAPRKKRAPKSGSATKSKGASSGDERASPFSLERLQGSMVEKLVRMELAKDPYRYVPAVREVELDAWDTPLAHDRVLQGTSIGLRMFTSSQMRNERGARKPTMSEVEQSLLLAEDAKEWGREARSNIDHVKVGMQDLFNETAIWVESGAWNAAKDALWRLRGLMNLMINFRDTREFKEEWGEDEQKAWAETLAYGIETEVLFEESIVEGIQRSVSKLIN
jgi:hypothetical protein